MLALLATARIVVRFAIDLSTSLVVVFVRSSWLHLVRILMLMCSSVLTVLLFIFRTNTVSTIDRYR